MGQSAADSYLFTSVQPYDNKSFPLRKRKCFIWETKCEREEKKSNISQGDFNTTAYLREGSGSGSGWREGEGVPDSVIWFYYLSGSRTRCWLTDRQEFESRSLISQLWWPADSSWWIFRTKGSPDSHAWLMNCEMRLTYKSCGQPRASLTTPPPLGQPLRQWRLPHTQIHLPLWLR